MSTKDRVVIRGFEEEDLNGDYFYLKDLNGYPAYRLNRDGRYFLYYQENLMPYANEGGYVILDLLSLNGAIPAQTQEH